MKDMKLETTGGSMLSERDSYPGGLSIHLGEAEIKKLGFPGIPEVGDTMELVGKVRVIHAGEHDHGEGRERMVVLQITHMDLEEDQDENKKSPEEALYGTQANPGTEHQGSVRHERGWGSYRTANG